MVPHPRHSKHVQKCRFSPPQILACPGTPGSTVACLFFPDPYHERPYSTAGQDMASSVLPKRHLDLKSKKSRALNGVWDDHNFHDKVMQWFTLIWKRNESAIVPESQHLLSLDQPRHHLRACKACGLRAIFCVVGRSFPTVFWYPRSARTYISSASTILP